MGIHQPIHANLAIHHKHDEIATVDQLNLTALEFSSLVILGDNRRYSLDKNVYFFGMPNLVNFPAHEI